MTAALSAKCNSASVGFRDTDPSGQQAGYNFPVRVALIPARGGSKRVPRKNVRNFAGRPMIGWAIDAARAAGIFDHILVSTDDIEIRDVAVAAGAEAPF